MDRIQTLKKLIDLLYQERRPWRADWADYMYDHHVFLVADCALGLSVRFWWSKEIAVSAAMLHDIADAVIKREDPLHEQESEKLARDFLIQSHFSLEEIEIIIGDIIKNHSCRDNLPTTLEWKIMATADAVVHLKSDFYHYALQALIQQWKTWEQIAQWALPKIERDFQKKIFFGEIREEVRVSYENCKQLFN